MSFFDKKQDVIDVKLTQFGKNLLARAFGQYFINFLMMTFYIILNEQVLASLKRERKKGTMKQ